MISEVKTSQGRDGNECSHPHESNTDRGSSCYRKSAEKSQHEDIEQKNTEDFDGSGPVDIDAFVEAITSDGIGSKKVSDIFNELEFRSKATPVIASTSSESTDLVTGKRLDKNISSEETKPKTQGRADDFSSIDIDSFVDAITSDGIGSKNACDIFHGLDAQSTSTCETSSSGSGCVDIDVVEALSALNDLKSFLGSLDFAISHLLEKAKEKLASGGEPLKCFTAEDVSLLELMLTKLSNTEDATFVDKFLVNQGILFLKSLLTILKDPTHWLFSVRKWADVSKGMSAKDALNYLSLKIKTVHCTESLSNVYIKVKALH